MLLESLVFRELSTVLLNPPIIAQCFIHQCQFSSLFAFLALLDIHAYSMHVWPSHFPLFLGLSQIVVISHIYKHSADLLSISNHCLNIYRMETSSPLFLGLDSSTQGLKAVVFDLCNKEAKSYHVHYDTDFPQYSLTSGVVKNGSVVTQPSLMVIESAIQDWLLFLTLSFWICRTYPLRK